MQKDSILKVGTEIIPILGTVQKVFIWKIEIDNLS